MLHFVARHGDEETFRLIFKRSKDYNINALNSETHALIHILIDTNKECLMKELVDSGAAVNTPGSARSALYYAIMKNNPSLVRYFLDHQADVNTLSVEKNTPLRYAVSIGNKEVVKMLLDAGADVNIQENVKKITPLHEACANFLSREALLSGSTLDYEEKNI